MTRPKAPWSDLRGKPLNERGLASKLHNYGIKRKQIRVGDWTGKGYSREDLHDAWTRYLPQDEKSETRETRETHEANGAHDVSDVSLFSCKGRDEGAALLLGRMRGLLLSVMCRRWKKRQMLVSPTRSPRSFSFV